MKRFALAMALVASAGSIMSGQKVVSEKELDQAMKTIGVTFRDLNAKLSTSRFKDAKVPLSLTRQLLALTGPFWQVQGKEDAAKMVRHAVEQLDTLDALASEDTVDGVAVAATVKEVTSTCAACHAVYREGDAQAGYKMKRESS